MYLHICSMCEVFTFRCTGILTLADISIRISIFRIILPDVGTPVLYVGDTAAVVVSYIYLVPSPLHRCKFAKVLSVDH